MENIWFIVIVALLAIGVAHLYYELYVLNVRHEEFIRAYECHLIEEHDYEEDLFLVSPFDYEED